jgi:hypothetical protein
MRRISQKRRNWLKMHARKGVLRNRRKRLRLQLRRLPNDAYQGMTARKSETRVKLYRQGVTTEAILEGEKKPVPAVLRLRNDCREETLGFINQVKEGLNRSLIRPPRYIRRMPIPPTPRLLSYWDFSTITDISVPVALMLASEYDRARELNGWVPQAVNIDTWHPQVRGMLNAIGFLGLAGVEAQRTATLDLPQGKFLRLRRGHSADGQAIGEYIQDLGIDLTAEDPRLNDAIMEAITNTVHHAYKHEELCEPHRLKAWWIAGSLIQTGSDRNLSIVVYDQGASIPRTLPTWDKYPLLRRALATLLPWEGDGPDPNDARYDGEAIRLAIQVGRTSTSESNRGKGLHQIVQALQLSKGGSVHIFSRCGVWMQRFGAEAQSINLQTPMTGTLIIWKLNL